MRLVVAFVCLPACGFAPSGSNDPLGGTTNVDAPPVRPIDAAIDAPPDAPPRWVTVETLTVMCSGATVTSTTVLAATAMYRLHASGECITNVSNGSSSDAEYFGYNLNMNTDTLNGVDNGISINAPTPGPTKSPHWGTYASDHVYDVTWPGLDATIVANYWDSNYPNNSGSLTLAILKLEY